jgi:septation ring formation regulator EzrA
MTIGKARCATCSKEKAILKCEGCLQTFCFNHVTDHRQELNKQLEDVEVTCDLIRERLTEQTTDSQKHPLLQKINEWEENSIGKIRTTAEEARKLLIKHTIGHIAEIEGKLSKVTNQIRQSRQENDFFETDVRQWKDNLTKIKEELPIKPSNITLRQDPTPIVTKIYLDISGKFITSIKTNLIRSHL